MSKRTISSIVAIIALIVIMFSPIEFFMAAVFFLALKAVHEFCRCLDKANIKPIEWLAMLWCLIIPVIILSSKYNIDINLGWFVISVFVSFAIVFINFVINFKKETIVNTVSTIFIIAYVVFSISCICLVRMMNYGQVLVWIMFIGAWATDSFAYLTGVLFGKKKIVPEVSPKKTVEGSIGGIFGCAIFMLVYGILFKDSFDFDSLYVVLLGVLCGIFSQLGDWAMSAFKRKADIKDFGRFMPGHGGVLDRFDSIIFIAPLVYGFLLLLT